VGQLQFIVIHLVHKQCGCNYHTNAIRTGHCITLNSAYLQISTSDKTPGGLSPSSSKVINNSSVYEYYVIKNKKKKNRVTKQKHSTTLLNAHRHLLIKIHFYIMYLITPWNTTWQHVQEMDKN
jgi:hypothetical protein